ncbi:MAG: PEGA domain-containing protein [Planctomycetes bacterium]|nr:PEGA domain-containing protein [Planctomycetota bacterium]
MILFTTIGVSGCVERRLTITSEPAGALVYLSDEEVGRTPVTVPFTWYGDYEVILRLDGYKTLQTSANIYPPLYDIPPWDLISQAGVPWTYRYNVQRHYSLEPLVLPDDNELVDSALELKGRILQPTVK